MRKEELREIKREISDFRATLLIVQTEAVKSFILAAIDKEMCRLEKEPRLKPAISDVRKAIAITRKNNDLWELQKPIHALEETIDQIS